MLSWLLQNCTFDVAVREAIVAAIGRRLEDAYQPVRIAAMHALANQTIPAALSEIHDREIYDRIFATATEDVPEDRDERPKARIALVYNGILECFQRLLNDPSPDVREKIGRTMVSCKTGEDVQNLTRQEVNSLLQVLEDAEPVGRREAVVRHEATYALQWLAEQGKSPEGEKNEFEACERQRVVSASVLRVRQEIGQLAEAPLEKVIPALHDRDIAVRIAAVDALEKISRTGQDTSGHMFEMFNDPCQQVRWRAQNTLHKMAWARVAVCVASTPVGQAFVLDGKPYRETIEEYMEDLRCRK